PRNAQPLTRQTQVATEQPGCIHAGMDLYKWAFKLGPLIESSLVLDCLELAADARILDMQASPYDLRDLGFAPIAVETPNGRREYARAQEAISERAAPLRARLLDRCAALQDTAAGE
ncbi:3-methyladenine DNA glycosylase, partial [Mycobacterium sp. ITM-2017-0098]